MFFYHIKFYRREDDERTAVLDLTGAFTDEDVIGQAQRVAAALGTHVDRITVFPPTDVDEATRSIPLPAPTTG